MVLRVRSQGAASLVMAVALLTGCGGAAEDAPSDASLKDFCAAREWFVTEGLARFEGGEFPPPEDDVAALARDWAEELTDVGTPANMSTDAREGFEKFIDRIDDLDGGDMGSFGWGDSGAWEGEAEESFANYVTNSC